MTHPALTEDQIQSACAAWLEVAYSELGPVMWHHSPNEGMHKPQYHVKQNRMGRRKGWPDLEFAWREMIDSEYEVYAGCFALFELAFSRFDEPRELSTGLYQQPDQLGRGRCDEPHERAPQSI